MKPLLAALPLLAILSACATAPSSDSTSAGTSPGWASGDAPNATPGFEGSRMSGEDIRARLAGRVLSGCFPDGGGFSEILADDGSVRHTQTGEALATYRIEGDRLCFTYPSRPKACYRIFADQRGLYFYQTGDSALSASTVCPIPSGTRGLN
ncbi:MAG: hypothetical protein HRU11_10500 [Parvularculaceae bacterium]|nr:hypothetical protein [Parvularculaceae bacterium]